MKKFLPLCLLIGLLAGCATREGVFPDFGKPVQKYQTSYVLIPGEVDKKTGRVFPAEIVTVVIPYIDNE